MQRIVLVSDAAPPLTSGPVILLKNLRRELSKMGFDVIPLTPDMFHGINMWDGSNVRLGLGAFWQMESILDKIRPDAIHILLEGPLGWAALIYCVRRNIPFTTSYTTNFPEYFRKRFGLSVDFAIWSLRKFHERSSAVMVTTQFTRDLLKQRGFNNITEWSRGVDTDLFNPVALPDETPLPYEPPIWIGVGRLEAEKNWEDFLSLPLPGTKLLIGSGSLESHLRSQFPTAVLLGGLPQEDLPRYYRGSDVFVFPSTTDTYGLVLPESIACGTPVATGTKYNEVVTSPKVGVLSDNLYEACMGAWALKRNGCANDCYNYVLERSWTRCAQQLVRNLAWIQYQGDTAPTMLPQGAA